MNWKPTIALLAAVGFVAPALAAEPMRTTGAQMRVAGPGRWPDQVLCHFTGEAHDAATGQATGRHSGPSTVIYRLAMAPSGAGQWVYVAYDGVQLAFLGDGQSAPGKTPRPDSDCYGRSIQQLQAAGATR